MSNASIWNPGSNNIPTANPNSQITREDFTATAGQTDFTLTLFTYAIGANALTVYVEGVKQSGDIITELSTSSFRIVGGVEAGDYVEVIGNTEAVSAEGAAVAAAASAAAALVSEQNAAASASILANINSVVMTFTNKVISLASNTISGTKALFNAALTDGDFTFQDSATGAANLPVGTTAQRPTGAAGLVRFNSDLNAYEGANNAGSFVPLGGGATGAAGNPVFFENDITVTGDYTVTTNKNAMSAGPVTVNNGVTITIPNGSVWSIV